MKSIFILSSSLINLGLNSEAREIIGLIKIADSTRAIMQILHMTKDQAKFFNNLSSQKSYDIARWFNEWYKKNKNNPIAEEKNIESLFEEFKENHTMYGAEVDEEYDEYGEEITPEERTIYSFIDRILEDISFYQKVKKDSLDQAFEKFKELIAMKTNLGREYFKVSQDLAWYNVGTKCDLVASFFSNCGKLNYLNQGEYQGRFTMMVLKNKKGIPLAVVTVGEVFDNSTESFIPVVTELDSAYTANHRAIPQEILESLFEMVRKKGLTFANLTAQSESEVPLKLQAAKHNTDAVRAAGFEIKDIEI